MDTERFDYLTRLLGDRTTRRGVLAVVAASAAGLPLREAVAKRRRGRSKRHRTGPGRVSAQGQADCAALCRERFPPGKQRGQCISDGAHGRGPCAATACTAQCPADTPCCDDPHAGCCTGPGGVVCTDLTNDPNCGACGVTCLDQSLEVAPGVFVALGCCRAQGCGILIGQPCNPEADPAQGELTCCPPNTCNPATSTPPSPTGHKCCQRDGESCLRHCDGQPDACAVCCSGVCDVANDVCVPG
jgi:hypothetical protein